MANLEYIDKQMNELGVESKKEDTPTLKDAAMFGAEFIPGVGEALAIKRTSDAMDQKDYVGAGIEATAGLLGVIPGLGDLAGKGLRVATKSFRKADVAEAEKLITDPKKIDAWRSSNKLPESQRQKNIPEAQQAAEDLFQNKIKSKKARKQIKDAFPEPKLYTAETMPNMPTITEVVGSMGKKSEKGILGVKGFDLEPGQRVGARLDIPAYNEYDKWVVSIHDGKNRNGSVVGYGQAIRLKNIEFGSDPKVALDIAKGKRVAKTTGEEKPMGKATIARVFGDYVPEDPYELEEFARKVLADKNSDWTQVGMNPYRGSYFYDKATGTPVTRADEVIQVGPLVLAKNVTKPKMSELKEMFNTPAARTAEGKIRVFNEGGAVPMKEQMSMFEDGGLLQEGGTVDPVSGNDVPPGSTQEEVRDDIPANLSEGEFVMPADVVRFHGLDKMMALRDEAKMGLQKMEDMGQMGNSEEATIPDDIPFSLDDLDMEDDGVQDFQVGGFVQQPFGTTPLSGTGIQGYQTSQFANYTPQYSAPPIPTATPYKAPTQQATPTAQATNIPTFEQSVKPTSVTYVNAAGAEIQIPVDAQGNPLIPVPEGFSKKGTATAAPTVPTEPVPQPSLAPQQKQKVDDGSDPMTPEELAEQRENQARISARKEAAKQLGYTNQIGAFEYLAGALIPAVGMMNKYDAGDIMPDGTISDGAGGTFDPVTGARESVKGGILGNMANEIAGVFGGGTKAEDAKISPAAKAMGLSPASMAGLMTIAGNQSINEAIGKPTLPGGMGTKPEQVTPETTQVETTLGKTAVTEAAKAAEPTTVSEAAKVEATPDNILASIGLKDAANLEEFKKKGGTIKVTDSGIVQTIMPGIGIRGGDVISSYSPNGTFIRQDTSATAESTTKGEYNIVSPSTTRKSPAEVTDNLIKTAIADNRRSSKEKEPSNNVYDLISSAARSSTRDRTIEGVQDMITREGQGGYNKQFSDDIKAGKYDEAFAERDRFRDDLVREVQKSEREEISRAAKEGRSPNISSRPAYAGEVSDGRGNVVRGSDGTSVKSGNPSPSSKGRAIAAEREQRNEDNSTDSRVICTELYRQGILNKQLYRLDVLYTARNLSPTLIRGYHYWAIPTVDLMRKSPALTKFLTYFTIKRAEEIAHIMNPAAYPKSTFTGRFIKTVGEGLCYAIGKVVKQKDYSILYNGKSV